MKPLRVVTWNCAGALRKKIDALDRLDADVYIIQECEDPAESSADYRDWCGDYQWTGSSKHKGLGVFPKNGHKVERLPWYGEFRIAGLTSQSTSTSWATSDLQLFLPISLNGDLTLLAVWTKGSDAQVFGYMGQFWKFLQIHRDQLSHERTLIMGDFNSNAIWDKADRWWSHSDCVAELAQAGLQSAYHHHSGETQGQETVPTFFLQRNAAKRYHIDYAFCSEDLLPDSSLVIGACEDWIGISDHMPLMLTVYRDAEDLYY